MAAGSRTSYRIPGFHPGQPIPVASRIANIIVTGIVSASEPATRAFAPDPEGQIRQMFANLGTILHAAGATFDDVVKVNVYVRDRAIREAINPIWVEHFPDENSRPARQTMQAEGLAGAALIQCDAMAVVA
jgi:2-iminobutanoate/2-iminopropanoate deaminase